MAVGTKRIFIPNIYTSFLVFSVSDYRVLSVYCKSHKQTQGLLEFKTS